MYDNLLIWNDWSSTIPKPRWIHHRNDPRVLVCISLLAIHNPVFIRNFVVFVFRSRHPAATRWVSLDLSTMILQTCGLFHNGLGKHAGIQASWAIKYFKIHLLLPTLILGHLPICWTFCFEFYTFHLHHSIYFSSGNGTCII